MRGRISAASARFGTLLGVVAMLMLACVLRAGAHEVTVRGLVLGVDRAAGRVIVRYEQAPGLPSATRSFAVQPRSALRALVPGRIIGASIDLDAHPWTLRDIVPAGREALIGGATPVTDSIFRNVHHVAVGEPIPNGAFRDQRGRAFDFRDERGRFLVLAFVYTRCADARVCPAISGKFSVLQRRFGDDVRLAEVTLDPAYDSPAALARYGARFGADPARWSLLTGDPETVLNFAAQFGVTAFPDARVGLIHAERTAIVDSDGVIRQLIDETSWAPDEIVAQVRADRRQSSNPLARLNLWLSSAAVALCGNSVAGFSGFTDLAIVVALFAGFGWLLFRIARAMYRSA
jgi:protein SCO1/2